MEQKTIQTVKEELSPELEAKLDLLADLMLDKYFESLNNGTKRGNYGK